MWIAIQGTGEIHTWGGMTDCLGASRKHDGIRATKGGDGGISFLLGEYARGGVSKLSKWFDANSEVLVH